MLFGAIALQIQAAVPTGPQQAQLAELRALDAKILEIGDRLAVANADICGDVVPVLGFAIHHLSQYGADYRPAAATFFGLKAGPSVLAVDAAGAALRAGVRADDVLVAADGVRLDDDGPLPAGASFARTEQLMDKLDAAFADGEARLDLLRSGQPLTVDVVAQNGCRGRFQLVPGGRLNAGADGRYIQISTALTLYAREDDELAAVLAHELAHNILRHRARLDEAKVSRGLLKSVGRNARLIRETEVEADRLSIYLLDRAGYPIEGATRFWRRFGPQHGLGIFASPTHPGWKKRVATMEQEAIVLARLKEQNPRPMPPLLQAPVSPPQ